MAQRILKGTLSITQKGFGFVIVGPEVPDVFVGRRQLADAIDGDRVQVRLSKSRDPESPRGWIIKVLQRARDKFIGTVYPEQGALWLALTPVTPHRGIRIRPSRSLPCEAGQVVVCKVLDWGTGARPILVQVTKVIGRAEDPTNDLDLVIHKYEYQTDFPKLVQAQVKDLNATHITGELGRRRDLRKWVTVTIDPVDARDFDDALSLIENDHGYTLGVHIADVSHFVSPGTPLDREALQRGTSVYFSEGVVPMLPEKLSADLCSLKPRVDRLSLSALIDLDRRWRVRGLKLVPAVINSNWRFSYQEVQEILDGKKGHKFKSLLKNLQRLSEALFKHRSHQGSIDFDIPEPIFSLGESGIPHEIRPSERLDSHRIVEECMLLANRLVATRIPFVKEQRRPFVYRIHDRPAEEDVERFLDLFQRLHLIAVPRRDKFDSSTFRDLLLQVEDSPYKSLIESVALRTMTKACYSTRSRGHFGLAFRHYTHFTSPIRRYPDLMVHRLIKGYQAGKNGGPEREALEAGVESSNMAELKALKAEREYIKIKQLRWLDTQIGNNFEGLISGVVQFGIFVELGESLAEGLVHIDTLEGDEYSYDEDHYCLRGRRTRREYRLGDAVRIRVLEVLFDKQRANFVLVEENDD